MRIGTYFSFATGLAAGAFLVGLNPKARQAVTEIKEKAVQKVEDTIADNGTASHEMPIY